MVRRALILLTLAALTVGHVIAETYSQIRAGQCVAYARSAMVQRGFSSAAMPGLCGVGDRSCSAYLIYDYWDLGYGRGNTPSPGLLVLNGWANDPAGHVAVIDTVTATQNGQYVLVGSDSNWYLDEYLYTNVTWLFDPATMQVRRENGSWHSVRGFVYSQPAQKPSSAASPADAAIGACLSRFSMYFGSRQGAAYSTGGFRVQLTTGGPYGAVIAIAVQETGTPPSTVWYWWYGWNQLPASVCY